MPSFDLHFVKRSLAGRQDDCGDDAFIKASGTSLFLALLDGLGHGKEAQRVTMQAIEFLAQHEEMELVELMQGLHCHMRGSRGLVASLCRLDTETGLLRHVGIGNITVRVVEPRPLRLLSRDGIIGYSISSPVENTVRLIPKDLLLLYSDGIKDHFEIHDYPGLFTGAAMTIATDMLRLFAKDNDDASCIAMRYNG